jgi:thioredoxin reductase
VASRGFDPYAVAGKFAEPDRRVEILIIGAGPAGIAAAMESARAGASVLLVDENPVDPGLMGLDTPLFYGGRYTGAVRSKARMLEQVLAANPDLEAAYEAGVEVELGVCCWGAFVPGYGLASLPGPVAGLADESRAWMVGFERLIVAAGARDVAFAFDGWDQPGVMGARALGALLHTYDAFAGRRIAVLGSGELAMRTAHSALAKGVEVAALIEVEERLQGPADLAGQLAAAGVKILTGSVPSRAHGGADGIEGLEVRDRAGGEARTLACDTIVEAVSLTPVVELLDVAGARLAMRPTLGGHVPESHDGTATSLAQVFVAGDAAGAPGGAHGPLEAARSSGRRAARAALASLGHTVELVPAAAPASSFDAVAYQEAWMRALTATSPASVTICQCEEVSREALLAVRQPSYLGPPSAGMAARDLGRLLEDGPANLDQIKRLTRAGMGPCQGRRCREQIALTIAGASNEPAARLPLAGYRAPVRPLPLKVLADWDEPAAMGAHWDVWFGIPGQWIPDENPSPPAGEGGPREGVGDPPLGGAIAHTHRPKATPKNPLPEGRGRGPRPPRAWEGEG